MRVLAPYSVPEEHITAFVQQKTDWVWRTLNRMRQKRLREIKHHFTAGEEFLFLGKGYPLYVATDDSYQTKLSFSGGRWIAVVSSKLTGPERLFAIKERMIRWYRKQAMEILGGRVFYYSRLMGLEPLRISVKGPKTLWGSCHHLKRSIHLNWKIIMAPLKVVDYVVVHELSHLRVPNHSRRFWREVEKILPDYKVRKQWFKENADKIHLD